jgi:hypothetical protein
MAGIMLGDVVMDGPAPATADSGTLAPAQAANANTLIATLRRLNAVKSIGINHLSSGASAATRVKPTSVSA